MSDTIFVRGLALHAHRVFARSHQIAHRLIHRIGHVNRRELPGARKPAKFQTISPLGLDPIGVRARGQAGDTTQHSWPRSRSIR